MQSTSWTAAALSRPSTLVDASTARKVRNGNTGFTTHRAVRYGILLTLVHEAPGVGIDIRCWLPMRHTATSTAWTREQLIDVTCEVGVLKLDIKKFSHRMSDFRNDIHPYGKMVPGFTPDEHEARVRFQVPQAVLASWAGERP